ncbi:MAG TPA: hypothetical protein H9707_03410 [Candidatus Butyricicoccus avicola]|nr:hypothetical protein [Candidatus Butyricicoccus avicola]
MVDTVGPDAVLRERSAAAHPDIFAGLGAFAGLDAQAGKQAGASSCTNWTPGWRSAMKPSRLIAI